MAPTTRGRKAQEDLEVDDWSHVIDLFYPGADRRRLRFQACLHHPLTERGENQQTLARKIGCDHKVLNYFLTADPVRQDGFRIPHRQLLAKALLGHERHEPWLTDGHWVAPDQSCLIPSWLENLRLLESAREFTFWLAVAHFRGLATGFAGDGRIIKRLGPADPWRQADLLGASAHFGPWEWYVDILPDMVQNPLKCRVMREIHERLPKEGHGVQKHGINHIVCWEKFPEAVQAASTCVPIPTPEQMKGWQRISDALPTLVTPAAMAHPFVVRPSAP